MYQFWYDYVNPKYDKKVKLIYMEQFHCTHKNRKYLQKYRR